MAADDDREERQFRVGRLRTRHFRSFLEVARFLGWSVEWYEVRGWPQSVFYIRAPLGLMEQIEGLCRSVTDDR